MNRNKIVLQNMDISLVYKPLPKNHENLNRNTCHQLSKTLYHLEMEKNVGVKTSLRILWLLKN